MSLAGKHAVVTGGGSGVGAAIAQQLAQAGAKVTIMGRGKPALEAQAAKSPNTSYQICDVCVPKAVASALDAARLVNGPVDIMVANAGAASSKPFAAMTPADLSDMLDVNLLGVFNCWQAVLPDMKATQWGRLIAVASTAGLKGYPYVSGYVAAKHAVVGLTRALSLELAQTGITTNALCPGFIDTPLLDRSIATIVEKTGMTPEDAAASLKKGNPQRRFIQTDEVAAAVLWLCSDAARSVNGTAIPISGGEV